jgi:hypothetical protein
MEIIMNIPTHYIEILFVTVYKCAGGANLKGDKYQVPHTSKDKGKGWYRSPRDM